MLRRTIIAVVAILAITGGTATAAKLITGKDVKNGSLTGTDIKNRSLGVGELTAKARASLRGQTGARGATGATGAAGAPGAKGDTGAKGDKGDQGDRGPSDAFGARIPGTKTINSGDDSRELIGGQLPAGKYLIQAKFVMENFHGVDFQKPNCELGIRVGNDNLFMAIDKVDVTVGIDDDVEDTEVTLMGLAEAPAANTPYLVQCDPSGETYDVRFRERVLIAVQVADLTAVGF